MYVQHSTQIWHDYPQLVPGVLVARGIRPDVSVTPRTERYYDIATERLAGNTESELPEIRAWRRTFSSMGLKPTQYRCASEALLRRFRQEHSLPQIHPLIDLCNAVSLAYAIPVAVLDVARVSGGVDVRYATGQERYLTFTGNVENPEPGEVVFADQAGQVHARRWTNRQSGESAVRDETTTALVVAEAMHETAQDDVRGLLASLSEDLNAVWSLTPSTAVLTSSAPRFDY